MSIFSKLFGSRRNEIPQEDFPNQEKTVQEEGILEIFDEPKQQTISFEENKKVSEPTDIPEGIKYVVEMQGKDYLTSRGFINILNDFHLLKDQKAVRGVLLNIQQDGLMDEIINTSSFQLIASSAKKKLVSDYGIKESIVSYVIDSIGYGLSYIETKPSLTNESNSSAPVNKGFKEIEMTIRPSNSGLNQMRPYDPKLDLEYYRYPPLNLLKMYADEGKPYIDMNEQTENKNNIVDVLRSLGVEVSSIKATVGQTITLYEMTLAPGVRISRIHNNEQTIAIRLAKQCRIIAPIPGRGTIGIELPNEKPNVVSMHSLVNSKIFQESIVDLPCLIGKSIENKIVLHDLTTDNLLIAGAIGQGVKDVLNSIILSLLFKKHPAELKLVLIDPTISLFNVYNNIDRHFLAAFDTYLEEPVISSAASSIETLKSLCMEMEVRLSLLKLALARNISEYNQKFVMRSLSPAKGHKYMPRIVLVIAEFGDLITVAGAEFEQHIAKLTQRGKLVGMHIVMATEQPTNKVVSPSIRMYFSSRIALRVASHLDSATILDQHGAEKLIGYGDALYSKGFSLTRIQAPFNDETEIEGVCRFISGQRGYLEPFELPNPTPVPDPTDEVDLRHLDPLFDDAARLIVSSQQGSTSLIQRKFSIGYNRAGLIMDQLEKAGVVGQAHGSKPRDVLIQDQYTIENLIRSLH